MNFATLSMRERQAASLSYRMRPVLGALLTAKLQQAALAHTPHTKLRARLRSYSACVDVAGLPASVAGTGLLYGGFCTTCYHHHHLQATAEAAQAAMQLIHDLDEHGRLDFHCTCPNPKFSNDYLFSKGPGRMFGVLVCQEAGTGQQHVLKAFSGQITEEWHIPGWVGPIASVRSDTPVYCAYRVMIESKTRALQSLVAVQVGLPPGAVSSVKDRFARQLAAVKQQRTALSHELFHKIQQSYASQDFNEHRLQLYDVYAKQTAPHTVQHHAQGLTHPGVRNACAKQPATESTSKVSYQSHRHALPAKNNVASKPPAKAKFLPPGVGDCCAPKLLHAASARGLRPVGLLEFWYGRPLVGERIKRGRQPQFSRLHKQVYGMCDKCEQVLGTMLCGCAACETRAGAPDAVLT